MTIPTANLYVRDSTLPGAGKGLFTKVFIPKGAWIAEYKGKIRTWKEVETSEADNAYIMYVRSDHIVDARTDSKALARYANDARGIFRWKGIVNNARYEYYGLSVFIVALKDIPADSEILVGYGKEYWQVIRENRRIAKQNH